MAVHLQFASEEEQIEARLNMGTLGIYGGGKSLLQGDWKGVGEAAGGWLLPLAPKGLGALGRIGAAVGRGSAVANATQLIGRTASAVARETAAFVGKHGKAAWSQVVHAGQEAGTFANRAWHQFQVGARAAAREAWGAVQTVAAEIHGRVQQLSETSFNGAWLPKKVAPSSGLSVREQFARMGITTSSTSSAASRTYVIYKANGEMFKFGVTDANLVRYYQSLKMAGPGSYGTFTRVVPKYQAHLQEKYLRSLHYSSTGRWSLPGMSVPHPVDFNTGTPIQNPNP